MSLLGIILQNGSGGTIGGGGTPPPPDDEYNDPVSGDIDFEDEDFNYSIPKYGGTGYWGRSPQAYVEFRTDETDFDVKVGGNWGTATSVYDPQSQLDIWVDGVYDQSVTLTADNTTQNIPVTLASGTKIVRIYNGYTANEAAGSITIPGNGVYVQGVVTTGDIEIKIPVEESKWLFIVDSNGVGALASHPPSTSFPAVIRATGQPVQLDGYGGRRILTYDGTLLAEMVNSLTPQLNSGDVLFILLGTNNWGIGPGHTAATFIDWYSDFIDAMHTALPSLQIVCVSPLDRTGYETDNVAGSSLVDYADGMVTMVSTRPWADFIFGRDLASISNMPDGLHLNDTGHAQMATNLITAYNAL